MCSLFDFLAFCFPDRYRSLNLSDIVEEDEEVFLRGSSQNLLLEQPCAVQNGISDNNDAELDFSKFGFLHGAESVTVKDGQQQKDSCLSAEPMKRDFEGLSLEDSSLLCADFFPLDQQDWEEEIIWANSPAVSDNNFESSEISGPDLGPQGCGEVEFDSGMQNNQLEPQKEFGEKDHSIFFCSSPVLLEPFGSIDSSGAKTNSLSKNLFHPQLLRLECRSEVDMSNLADGQRENIPEEHNESGLVKHFSKVKLQNQDMMEGSWIDNIIWEEVDRSIVKQKLIFDLQDDQMHFEVLDSKDGRHLRLHAGAMILSRSLKSSSGDSSELPGHGGQHGWRAIANDKHYSNRKTSQQLKPNSRKRSAHGVKVFHSQPALKLQTMKLKLSK